MIITGMCLLVVCIFALDIGILSLHEADGSSLIDEATLTSEWKVA